MNNEPLRPIAVTAHQRPTSALCPTPEFSDTQLLLGLTLNCMH